MNAKLIFVAVAVLVAVFQVEARSIEEIMQEVSQLEAHIANHEGNTAEQEVKLDQDLQEMTSLMTQEQRANWEHDHQDLVQHWEKIKSQQSRSQHH